MIVLIGLAMGVGISFRRGGDDKEREIGYDFRRYEIRTERRCCPVIFAAAANSTLLKY